MASEDLEVSEREFQWSVNAAGYRWLEVSPRRWPVELRCPVSMLTVADVSTDQRYWTRKYAPLRECPALFHTFADTPVTREGILQFANRYGTLGGDASRPLDDPMRKQPSPEESSLHGEWIANWMEHIFSMRQAIALWEMTTSGDVAGLGKRFHWDER
jgi:hypothetical protein